jgi:hypothetical protein
MKLTGQVELAVVAALVGVIAFMPKVLSFIVSSAVGKAVAFAFVAWLWKQHNELVALLLAIAYLRAMPAYEHADDKSMKKPEHQTPPVTTPSPPAGH